MPNYSFVVDATYNPLTYEEIAAPVREAAAYHQALQDKYDEMKLTTQMYDALIPKDDPAYAQARQYYDTYISALNQGADALMNHGSWGQRDTLSGVRESFGKYMLPVQKAWEKRDLEAKEQRDRLAKNPMLEFSRDASASGLDMYLNNLNSTYKTVDPVSVTSMVATAAAAFKNEIRRNPQGELALEMQKTDPEGYLAITSGQGLRPEHVLNWMKYPSLYNIMKNTLNSFGMDIDENGVGVGNDVWSADAVNRVLNKAYTGFASGVGGETLQLKEDQEYAAKMAMQAAALKNATANATDTASAYFLPNNTHWALDDAMTDTDELTKIQNAAAMLGFGYDAKTNTFNEKASDIDALQGMFSNMIPFRRSGDEIFQEIAQDNGWTYSSPAGFFNKGKRVPRAQMAKALAKQAEKSIASYHTMQDVSLSDYNAGFKGLRVHEFKGFMKDGTYKKEKDHPVPLSNVLGDQNSIVSVGLDMTSKTEGLTIRVSNDGETKYYHVDTNSINNSAIKSAVTEAVTAAQRLNKMKKQMGLSDEEWSDKFANQQATYEMGTAQLDYVEAVKKLMNAIGSTNSTSNINISNT